MTICRTVEELIHYIKENKAAGLTLFNVNIDLNAAKKIAQALKNNTTLETLYLDNNKLGDAGFGHILAALKDNNTFHGLCCDNNSISDEGAYALEEFLKNNKCIKFLTLNNNSLTNEGLNSISEGLKNNNSLKNIALYNNNISDLGINYIASALIANRSLEKIDLSGNNISNIGISSLKDALKVNTHLKTLFLNDINLCDIGIGYLAEALRSNNSLEAIYLDKNHISDNGLRMLAQALNVNKIVSTISFFECPISDVGLDILLDLVTRNSSIVDLSLIDANNYKEVHKIIDKQVKVNEVIEKSICNFMFSMYLNHNNNIMNSSKLFKDFYSNWLKKDALEKLPYVKFSDKQISHFPFYIESFINKPTYFKSIAETNAFQKFAKDLTISYFSNYLETRGVCKVHSKIKHTNNTNCNDDDDVNSGAPLLNLPIDVQAKIMRLVHFNGGIKTSGIKTGQNNIKEQKDTDKANDLLFAPQSQDQNDFDSANMGDSSEHSE